MQTDHPFLILFLVSLFLAACGPDQSTSPPFQLHQGSDLGIDFVNQVDDTEAFNIIQYLYFYNGGGVAAGDLNNDGLPDLYFTANQKPNQLYINKGNLEFINATESGDVSGQGNWTTGVSMVDVNADGWLDLYVCQVGGYKNFAGKNQLFINQGSDSNGSPIFTEEAEKYGLDHEGFSTQAAFFDYDLDGDLDMYLLTHSVHSTESYRDTSSTRKKYSFGDKLYRQDEINGQHKFIDVTDEAGIYSGLGGYGLGICISDLNEDRFPDIYIGNDFHENDFLYLNNGDGTFSESIESTTGHISNFSMGCDIGDLDGDGLADIITLDMKPNEEFIRKTTQGGDSHDIYRFKRSFGYHHQLPRNMLQFHQGVSDTGIPYFSEQGQLADLDATDWSWSALLLDFNLDGKQDIHITNGIARRPNDLDYLKYIANKQVQEEASDLELLAKMPNGSAINRLLINRGEYIFSDAASPPFTADHANGAAYADLDADGDWDLAINNLNAEPKIIENLARQQGQNYLKISLRGFEKNSMGLGTKVQVYCQDQIQTQELQTVRGWLSSVEPSLIFGLDNAKRIDTLIVTWPDGRTEKQFSLATNQHLTINHQSSAPGTNNVATVRPFFRELQDTSILPYRHRENRFFDSTREPLIPMLLSREGPAMAIGDINGDRHSDVLLGGAAGQPSQLFLWQNDQYVLSSQPYLHLDRAYEDVTAAFFDLDGDSDLDLVIGSGGNQFVHSDTLQQDRVYINEGDGQFTRDRTSLPQLLGQTSSLKPGDFDGDGDIDLFLGTLSQPLSYGLPVNSHLLINQGNGKFLMADSAVINLAGLGMVKDATWLDLENDGDLDLIVVGHWMDILVYTNHQNKLRLDHTRSINQSGWWNCVESADLDSDGDMDLVVGNLGLNHDLNTDAEFPIRLYVNDFDNNLSREAILTRSSPAGEFTFASLDELAAQLPSLKKQYLSYDAFGAEKIGDIFPPEKLKRSVQLTANQFASIVAWNDGNGNFRVELLPRSTQVSTVNAIAFSDLNQDQHMDILLAGNTLQMHPSIGRMDASFGSVLLGNKKSSFEIVPSSQSGMYLRGEIKELHIVRGDKENVLIAVRNNDRPQIFNIENADPY